MPEKEKSKLNKMLSHFLQKKGRGTTMVELVVTFALLGIFLSAVTMVITNSLTTYYSQQRLISMYSVADVVMGELKNDIRSMQGSVTPDGTALEGFVKLRDASGIVGATDRNPSTGSTIEFLKSNEYDGLILEQLDAGGCSEDAALIDSNGIIKNPIGDTVPANRLTARFYLMAAENSDKYKKHYFDVYKSDCQLADATIYAGANGITTGQEVVWDAIDKLPRALYQDFLIRTEFEVTPHSDGNGHLAVSQVTARVSIYDALVQEVELPGGITKKVSTIPAGADPVYTRETIIPLQNTVWYSTDKTLYSDE